MVFPERTAAHARRLTFPPVGDNWKGLLPDQLNLTQEGYETWAATLNPVLAKFVKIEPYVAPKPPAG